MKIAILAECYFPEVNGVSQTLNERLIRLSRWGHEVALFVPDYAPIQSIYPGWRAYTGNILPGVKVIPLPSQPFFTVASSRNPTFGAHRRFVEELSRFQPDVLHVDAPERAFLGFLRVPGLEYARRRGIPCVAMYHTHYLEIMPRYDDVPLPLSLPGAARLLAKLISAVYNRYDRTIVNSSHARVYLEGLGVRNAIHVQACGVDTARFHPSHRRPGYFAEELGLTGVEERTKLIVVGRLSPEKGWAFLVEALRELSRRQEASRLALFIAGDGAMKEKLRSELRFLDQVHLLGWVSHDHLPALLSNCDVLMSASEIETKGLTVLEAFASGVPVLGARALGLTEDVVDGVNGYLFTPRSTEDFLGKLSALVRDPARRAAMGAAGRKVAEAQDWDVCTRLWLSALERRTG